MSAVHRVDSFGLALPDEWTAVPTERALFDRFCETQRDRWRETEGWDRALERRLDTLLARARHELVRSGCVLAALFADTAFDDSSSTGDVERDEIMLLAACTLGVYTKADFKTKMSLSLPVLFSALAKQSRSGADEERQFGRITNLTRPGVAELPAGRAVQLRRVYEPRKLGLKTEPFFAESFIWPIGDDGEGCCVLQFATTNTDQARPFSNLFGAIANTFRMFEPDQPTSFD